MSYFLRVAVYTATLLFCLTDTVRADYTPQGLLFWLTGLDSNPTFEKSGTGINNLWSHPVRHFDDPQSYIELTATRHEFYRTLRGPYKNSGDGKYACAYKQFFNAKKAGVYASFSDLASSISWPLSKNRVRARHEYDTKELLITGFLRAGDRFMAGATLGKSYARNRENLIRAVQVTGKFPLDIQASLSVSSKPYEWSIAASFQSIDRTMSSRFKQDEIDGSLSFPLRRVGDMTVRMSKGWITTPGGFKNMTDNHAQVWNSDRKRWFLSLHETSIPRIGITIGLGREMLSGDFGLWYNTSRYMRSSMDIDNHRFMISVEQEGKPGYVPGLRFDRISTDVELPYGSADSWPFTPKQLEIIGDKTWTGQGSGSFVSNGLTFFWTPSGNFRFSTSFFRIYPDYRLKITTRDHLSSNPFNMIFGRSRIESDTIRYAEFASLSISRQFVTGSVTIDTGLRQLIPIRQVKVRDPGKEPGIPSFPDISLKKPRSFGGLSFWLGMRYSGYPFK